MLRAGLSTAEVSMVPYRHIHGGSGGTRRGAPELEAGPDTTRRKGTGGGGSDPFAVPTGAICHICSPRRTLATWVQALKGRL